MTDVGSGIAIRRLEKENAALRDEVERLRRENLIMADSNERLRAYLPLARAVVAWSVDESLDDFALASEIEKPLLALSPEQRQWLMEDK